MLVCEIAFGTPAFDEAVCLRDKLLRQPLGLVFTTEQLAEEYNQIHLGAYDTNLRLVGCLSLVPIDDQTWKMRQVAVDETQQGKGIGKLLVDESEQLARSRGVGAMMMHAREVAVPFYLKLGYQKVGKKFEEVGIPHYRMERTI